MICYKCKKSFEIPSVSRTTECPHCRTDLHVCKACKFYSQGSHYDCKESVEDPVNDKEKANFCDWFKYGSFSEDNSSSGEKSKSDAAKDAFNALFS